MDPNFVNTKSVSVRLCLQAIPKQHLSLSLSLSLSLPPSLPLPLSISLSLGFLSPKFTTRKAPMQGGGLSL